MTRSSCKSAKRTRSLISPAQRPAAGQQPAGDQQHQASTTLHTSYKVLQAAASVNALNRQRHHNSTFGSGLLFLSFSQNTSSRSNDDHHSIVQHANLQPTPTTTNGQELQSHNLGFSFRSHSQANFPLRPIKISLYQDSELNNPSCGIYPHPNMSRHSNPK